MSLAEAKRWTREYVHAHPEFAAIVRDQQRSDWVMLTSDELTEMCHAAMKHGLATIASIFDPAAMVEEESAVEFIRVVGEELVMAGYPAGDRDVILQNLRQALSDLRSIDALLARRDALEMFGNRVAKIAHMLEKCKAGHKAEIELSNAQRQLPMGIVARAVGDVGLGVRMLRDRIDQLENSIAREQQRSLWSHLAEHWRRFWV
jgi:hypothetical protein